MSSVNEGHWEYVGVSLVPKQNLLMRGVPVAVLLQRDKPGLRERGFQDTQIAPPSYIEYHPCERMGFDVR